MRQSDVRNLFVLSAASTVLAVTSSAWAVSAPPPAEKHYGRVAYATGGIAQDEAARFRRLMDRYPLAIELLEKSGRKDEYTADAAVKIVDRAGRTVLDARAEGPYMLVRLVPGRYDVKAELGGRTLRKSNVEVRKGASVEAVFEFPPHTG